MIAAANANSLIDAHAHNNPTTGKAMHMKRRKGTATTQLSVQTEGLTPADTTG